VFPPVPHAVGDVPLSHVDPLQHPFGHELPLQTHSPFTHACFGPHAAPPPQVHAPAVSHPSPEVPQLTQVPPDTPHVAGACPSHTLPLQQPPGHDVELQTQLPLTHCCPGEHAAPVPQEHAPPWQPLASVIEHGSQVAPSVPHADTVRVVLHSFAWQQPVGHDSVLHVHVPLTHSCPALHMGPSPHEQAPSAEQLFASVWLHALHDAPAVPHVASELTLQVGPVQHPAHICMQPEHTPALHP
jgi:hypothetical protein